MARRLRSNWEEVISDLGLSPPHAAILRTIHEADGEMGLREVARRLGTDPMNVKRGIDFLEAEGFIISDLSERGKPRYLSLTDRGLDAVSEVINRVNMQELIFKECLTPEEILELSEIVDKLQDHLDTLPPRRKKLES